MLRMAASDSARALHDAGEVALEQRDAGAFDGDIVPVPMAMPTCGGGERRGVVDAVAGHGDDAAFAAQFLDHRAFLLGQHLGFHFGDAEALGDGVRGGAVVAGEHHDADAVCRAAPSSAAGVVALTGSAMAMAPASLPSTARKMAVAPSLRAAVRLRCAERRGVDVRVRREIWRCRARARLPSTMPVTPLPAGASKFAHVASVELALGGGGDDRRGERMFAAALDAGGEAQDLRLVKAAAGDDRDHLRLAFGQRAGLVDHQRVDLFHPLQRFGILDQHAGLRAAADADHDRHRRGEPERAGAGDDQHAHRRDQPVGKARLRPERRPGGERDSATAITAGTNQPAT